MTGGRTAPLEAALRSLFPPGVATAVVPIGGTNAPLWREEAAAMSGAVPARVAEFVAGRTAARRALADLGLPPVPLPMGPDRAPHWPTGISGSITHAAGYAMAVARRGAPLGVDLEQDAPIPPDLWPTLCRAEELERLGREPGHLVRQIFAAKEAVFKAQDTGRRAMFGFDVVSVTLVTGGFEAHFLDDAGAFRVGQVLQGRLALCDDMILAGVGW